MGVIERKVNGVLNRVHSLWINGCALVTNFYIGYQFLLFIILKIRSDLRGNFLTFGRNSSTPNPSVTVRERPRKLVNRASSVRWRSPVEVTEVDQHDQNPCGFVDIEAVRVEDTTSGGMSQNDPDHSAN